MTSRTRQDRPFKCLEHGHEVNRKFLDELSKILSSKILPSITILNQFCVTLHTFLLKNLTRNVFLILRLHIHYTFSKVICIPGHAHNQYMAYTFVAPRRPIDSPYPSTTSSFPVIFWPSVFRTQTWACDDHWRRSKASFPSTIPHAKRSLDPSLPISACLSKSQTQYTVTFSYHVIHETTWDVNIFFKNIKWMF